MWVQICFAIGITQSVELIEINIYFFLFYTTLFVKLLSYKDIKNC